MAWLLVKLSLLISFYRKKKDYNTLATLSPRHAKSVKLARAYLLSRKNEYTKMRKIIIKCLKSAPLTNYLRCTCISVLTMIWILSLQTLTD